MSEKIVSIGEDDVTLKLAKADGRLFITHEGKQIELLSVGDGEAIVAVDGQRSVVPFMTDGDRIEFQVQGEVYSATVAEQGARKRKRGGEHSMSAPMPGVVLKVMAAVGDKVAKGTPLIVLEAMKMEHQLTAPTDGVVKKVNCREGELVQPGIDLIELE
jgi:3-methylcrotonyl-CoA carboxylase alpha subunit